MPTENRRVAAYLPKEVDDRLEAFKAERGLSGDSAALIAILSEYFGIGAVNPVAHSSFATLEQLNELRAKVEELSEAIRSLSSPGRTRPEPKQPGIKIPIPSNSPPLDLACPHCQQRLLKPHGSKGGKKSYLCVGCGRSTTKPIFTGGDVSPVATDPLLQN